MPEPTQHIPNNLHYYQGPQHAIKIEPAKHGGFVVMTRQFANPSQANELLFAGPLPACTHFIEAYYTGPIAEDQLTATKFRPGGTTHI